MHILKIIHGYPPLYSAGSEVYSQNLCEALDAMGQRVSIVTREENPYVPEYEIRTETRGAHTQIYYINRAQSKDGYRQAGFDRCFAALLGRLRPDVAHIGHLNHLSTGIVEALAAAGVPIVFTLHDFWLMCPRGQFLQRNSDGQHLWRLCGGQDDRKCAATCYSPYFSGDPAHHDADLAYWQDWVRRRMADTRALCRHVRCFIAPSRYLRERFIRDFGLDPERIVYLDYGFPLQRLQPLPPRPAAKPFRFAYIGTHIPAKGVNLLLEAFATLPPGAATLHIWGYKGGQGTAALMALAQQAANPVVFGGPYDNRHLRQDILAHSDAIVVPSIWAENAPLVIHEAQACRRPVITADFGGMAEYVGHLENGLLFAHRSADSLAEQLRWAIAHPEAMARLGQRGYRFHPEGEVPDIGAHARQILDIYTNTITQAHHEHGILAADPRHQS